MDASMEPKGPEQDADRPRRAWVPPRIEALPPLNELTLQTGDFIPGGGGRSGGTVF